MRINRNDKILNIPIIKIRDYFRGFRNYGFLKTDFGQHFRLSTRNRNLIINELLQQGYIEKANPDLYKYLFNIKDKRYLYLLTEKGNSLCVARSIPPLTREKADKIFSEFMERVEEINNDDYYLCRVDRVILFGSYLNPESKDFGDIDIAFELKDKFEDHDEYDKARKKRIKEVEEKGKYFSSFIDELFYPEKEVKLKLKNKCPYISLHYISTEKRILETTNRKQVYPK